MSHPLPGHCSLFDKALGDNIIDHKLCIEAWVATCSIGSGCGCMYGSDGISECLIKEFSSSDLAVVASGQSELADI